MSANYAILESDGPRGQNKINFIATICKCYNRWTTSFSSFTF